MRYTPLADAAQAAARRENTGRESTSAAEKRTMRTRRADTGHDEDVVCLMFDGIPRGTITITHQPWANACGPAPRRPMAMARRLS